MQLPADADLLIPHNKPMRVVDRLLESDGTAAQAEGTFDIESLFVDDGKIDRLAVLELVAQSYAAGKGHEDLAKGKTGVRGFLVGISNAVYHSDAYAGEHLTVAVRTEQSFGDFYIVVGKAFQKQTLVLEATLKIWLSPDSGQ
jgi:predicted hotdog family 3-hydroxylacyl-ACP dehydratase